MNNILLNPYLYEDSINIKEDKEVIQQLTKYKEENKKLQYQLNLQSAKESIHITTMEKIKQIQNDFDKAYQQIYLESKENESKLKEQYHQYSIQLEATFNQKELNYISKIESLTKEILNKNEQINQLTENLREIIDENVKNELEYKERIKGYEESIQSKEKKLIETEQALRTISSESSQKIETLSEKLMTFQSRIKSKATIDLEHNNNNNANNNAPKESIEDNINIDNIKDTIKAINERNNSLYSLKSAVVPKEECCSKCNDVIKKLQSKNDSLQFQNKKLSIDNIVKEKVGTMRSKLKTHFELSNHSKMTEQFNPIRIRQLENTARDYGQQRKCEESNDSGMNMQHSQRYYTAPSVVPNATATVENSTDKAHKTKAIISRNKLSKNFFYESCDSFQNNNRTASLLNKSSLSNQSANSLRKLNSSIVQLQKIIQQTRY